MILLTGFVILPLAGAFLIALLARRFKGFGDIMINLVALILCLNSFSAVKITFSQKVLTYNLGAFITPLGVNLSLDSLSSFMLVIVNFISLLAMLYSTGYMQRYTDRWKFQALVSLMLAGMNGILISGDLFNLYIFLEIASISAYILVAFGVESADLEAAFKYAIMGIFASTLILLGIGLLYSYTSSLNMADISFVLAAKPGGILMGFISVLFLAGFGLKAAIVPFHAWLPDAHTCAPSPVSALLSGIFIKTLGVYALARVFFNIIGVSSQLLFALMVLGAISMVVGACLAVAQDDIKRMFAYSTISQVGYIIFAFGVGTPLAIAGGLFYLLTHALSKSLLFLNAGAIEYSCASRSLKKLGGLHAELPAISTTSLIAAMSICGIPPFAGFWSKLLIIIAAVEAGHLGFAVLAVLVSIMTLVYYLKFQNGVFFGKLNPAAAKIRKVPLEMVIVGIILALACVFAGLMLMPGTRPFLQQAASVLSGGTAGSNVGLGCIR